MSDFAPCTANGHTLEEINSGLYWLIAPGVDPASILTQEQIDCHMAAMEVVNASYEASVASDGKFVQWRSSPTWVDFTSPSPVDWFKAEPLTESGIDCDPDAWDAAYEPTPHFRWLGSSAKGLVTYYCIGDSPVEPPVDPPDPGPAACGSWTVAFVRPISIPYGVPTWVDFELIGTFPPEVVSDFEFSAQFGGVGGVVAPDTTSGVLAVDGPGRKIQVVLLDELPHEIDIIVVQPDCDSPLQFDSETVKASTAKPAVCLESFGNTGARVCAAGVYKAVITVCDQDFDSNEITIDDDGVPGPRLPVIIVHPATQTVTVGDRMALTVVALYAETYQWQIANSAGWIDIAGETTPNLAFDPVSLPDSGRYRVIVSNSAGSVTSNVAILTVVEDAECATYLVLRCDTDSTCHGVHLVREGEDFDSISFVLDWSSSTALCDDPPVVMADDDSFWELFMTKVGPDSEPSSYVIDWRAATSAYTGERQLYFAENNQCYRVVMSKVGPGDAKEDYVLSWENL